MSDEKITPLIMPKWGLSMKEGKLSDWLIEEGTNIAVGDEIMEVETDKIANVVEAADPGLLRRRVATAGETYPVRALLGVLASEDISDADVDAFIEAFEMPVIEDDDDAEAAPLYEFAETSVGRLRYAVRGNEGPVVLLIHGFGGDLDNWLFNIDALATSAKVYALDLPGHGQSTKQLAGADLSGLATAVLAFMDTVGVESAHLVGHSVGGGVAATMAFDAPDRVLSLSLISSAGLGREINSQYIDGFVNSVSRRELKPVLINLFADSKLVSRSLIDDLLKYKRIDGVQGALESLSAALFADGEQKTILTEKISSLDVKTLVVWGAVDEIIPASHAQSLENADVQVIQGAGHMVQMEQASQVNDLIKEHIAG